LPITFSNSLRYKHISILNNSVLSTSILYPVDLEDTSNYLINNDIKILNNTLYTNSLGYRQDRVGYDLFVPNNLTVAGDINVLGDLNVSGNIIFSSNKKISKTYWLYNYQIVNDPGSTTTTFNATDAMGYLGGPWASSARVLIGLGGNYYYPKVRVSTGEYVSLPIDISLGQKLTKVIIHGGISPSNQISYKIISRFLSGGFVTPTEEYSSPVITVNANSNFVDNLSFKPTNDYRVYSIVIKNENSSGYDEYSCLNLEFESNNLFELIGIS
jgi:hypothetical protein